MSTLIAFLAVLMIISVLCAALLFLFTLPTIVKGYRQRRKDEFALAELRTAEMKARRHRNHP
jgi:competence protein ComGC